MKNFKNIFTRAVASFVIFTVICGIGYTGVITALAQVIFPYQSNGSIIEIDGKKYGSELMGQQYTDDTHMWGRIMNLDVSTYTDKDGNTLMYASPSNLSPASEEYAALVQERIDMIKSAHESMGDTPIPVDLVTCSGSGLDPQISLSAAEYQVKRIAEAKGITDGEVHDIISKCTDSKFLGVFGEKTVNVLKVNLMLDGIL